MAIDARAQSAPQPDANVPSPPSERRAWLLALATGATGVIVLVAVLLGGIGRASSLTPPQIRLVAGVPRPAAAAEYWRLATAAGVRTSTPGAPEIVGNPSAATQQAEASRLRDPVQVHIARQWLEGFYPIYETAQDTFGVSWLLIA